MGNGNRWVAVLLGLVAAVAAWAAGEAEGGSTRSVHLASRGAIMPAGEIRESSFIAAVDYGHPQPAGPVGVSVHTGRRQISSPGQEEAVVVGVQGRRGPSRRMPR